MIEPSTTSLAHRILVAALAMRLGMPATELSDEDVLNVLQHLGRQVGAGKSFASDSLWVEAHNRIRPAASPVPFPAFDLSAIERLLQEILDLEKKQQERTADNANEAR